MAQDSSHRPSQSDSELAFRESAQSYLSLFDSLAELVFIAGLDGRLLSVNKALLHISRTLFAFQIFAVVQPTPGLEYLLERARRESGRRSAGPSPSAGPPAGGDAQRSSGPMPM